MSISKWEKKPLKQLCHRIGDGLHGTPNYTEDKQIFFINGNNLKNGKIEITVNTKAVTEDDLQNNYIELDNNTLLLSINGTIGSMAFYNNEKVMLGKSAAYLNFKTDINKFYYYYFQLKDVQQYFYNVATGSTIKNLSLKSIQDFEVPVPVESQWRCIANVLSNLDAKIELNYRINRELEGMAKLLYDYWFVQFDFPDNLQDSSLSGAEGYKSAGGKMVYNQDLKREIPEGWEVKPLGNIINIYDSLRVPLSKSQREIRNGTIPYYGATSVMDYVNDYLFDDDYILLAEDGSVMDKNGMPIVQFIWGKTWVNNHAHVIQANDKLHNEFVYQLVKMIPVVLIKTGSIQMKINQENLKKHKVLVPSMNYIKAYSKKASSIRKQLINNIEQNQKLTSLRDWLLPMLMNGQVTVKEAEEKVNNLAMVAEPATEYKTNQ